MPLLCLAGGCLSPACENDNYGRAPDSARWEQELVPLLVICTGGGRQNNLTPSY